MPANEAVSHAEWLKARLELLAAERDLTHQSDALTRRRMAMPWERVEKAYWFEGPDGALSLVDLFDGRSQLIVHHFMFDPDWEEGCIIRTRQMVPPGTNHMLSCGSDYSQGCLVSGVWQDG